MRVLARSAREGIAGRGLDARACIRGSAAATVTTAAEVFRNARRFIEIFPSKPINVLFRKKNTSVIDVYAKSNHARPKWSSIAAQEISAVSSVRIRKEERAGKRKS